MARGIGRAAFGMLAAALSAALPAAAETPLERVPHSPDPVAVRPRGSGTIAT